MSTPESAASLVRTLWQYCNVLRDDGLSYPDYVEQLTYLLFLKMADEQGGDLVPSARGWRSLATLDAADMQAQYEMVLAELGEHPGTLGMIFRGARNKIGDPGKLRFLVVELVGQIEWTGLSPDVKGDAYEGLLEKNARDTKSGAGQYFTPRPLVDALVECIDPQPGESVCDPACGTGGFLLAAHDHVRASSAADLHPGSRGVHGVELVQEVARLAAMNLYLHGVSGRSNDDVPVQCADSLSTVPAERVDIVLTNPPFGTKGSVTYASKADKASNGDDDLVVVRPDFWARTANKQLNFLQHITSLLRPSGRAAVVVPDNVLFESGAATAVRRRLLNDCDVHTLLRLPPGLFYAHGVLANVIFFDAEPSPASKRRLWVYDFRAGNRFSLKTRPLRRADLDDFVGSYRAGEVHRRSASDETSRWRSFRHEDLLATEEARMDLSWQSTEEGERSAPSLERVNAIGLQVAEDLQRALAHVARFQAIATDEE